MDEQLVLYCMCHPHRLVLRSFKVRRTKSRGPVTPGCGCQSEVAVTQQSSLSSTDITR